ncbi:MAG: hypothetical protein HY365_02485 [Candidatus Aenigmarchaeota archaeon]|nr:hypothetical protein [Candidatus Aenigmarchaeota archaeon]
MTIPVVLSGLPGSISTEVMKAIRAQPDMTLLPYALTGPTTKESPYDGIALVGPDGHEACLRELLAMQRDLLAVDFSRADMARQASLYADVGVPFVYGGTIGNRADADEVVRANPVSAVIAPNMSKQLVAWTAALEYLAHEFPGAFTGYRGHLRESHQQTKRDPSGTGRAWTQVLAELGITFDEMESVREPAMQRELGVPDSVLSSHAYHWVDLSNSGMGAGFYTRVNGRRTYADGAVDAIRYLSRKMREGSMGEVFSMTDVLRNR